MRGRGGQEFRPPGLLLEGPACLASVCIQGNLKAVKCGQAGRVVETTFFGYRDV